MFVALSDRLLFITFPSDSRQAILLVTVGDKGIGLYSVGADSDEI